MNYILLFLLCMVTALNGMIKREDEQKMLAHNMLREARDQLQAAHCCQEYGDLKNAYTTISNLLNSPQAKECTDTQLLQDLHTQKEKIFESYSAYFKSNKNALAMLKEQSEYSQKISDELRSMLPVQPSLPQPMVPLLPTMHTTTLLVPIEGRLPEVNSLSLSHHESTPTHVRPTWRSKIYSWWTKHRSRIYLTTIFAVGTGIIIYKMYVQWMQLQAQAAELQKAHEELRKQVAKLNARSYAEIGQVTWTWHDKHDQPHDGTSTPLLQITQPSHNTMALLPLHSIPIYDSPNAVVPTPSKRYHDITNIEWKPHT